MDIQSVKHKGLRRLLEQNNPKGLKADQLSRLKNVLSALLAANQIEDLQAMPGWRVHTLTGSRPGTWSISVSGNWRLTFRVENGEIADLDLEDYH